MALEHDNFRAALEWLTETGDAEWGLRLGGALFRFWETREYLAEGTGPAGQTAKDRGSGGAHQGTQRGRLFAAGVLPVEQGDYAAAEALIRESLEIARQLGDSQGAAVSLNALAVSARDRGDIRCARSLFEESLTAVERSGRPEGGGACS